MVKEKILAKLLFESFKNLVKKYKMLRSNINA